MINNVLLFHFVAPGNPGIDEQVYYPNVRVAINDAVVASYAGHTRLYHVQDDGSEVLIYDSLKCKGMSTDQILRWAEKGGHR